MVENVLIMGSVVVTIAMGVGYGMRIVTGFFTVMGGLSMATMSIIMGGGHNGLCLFDSRRCT